MNTRKLGGSLVTAALIVLVGSLFLGQVLGQPVLLGYVETGSMAPTLQPGDGFVAVPMALAGPVEPGDVVVFDAETLQGGGLTTHRVVGETEGGYVTRGDANPVTDQDSGEPPVSDEQIVAEVLQIGGRVVVVPSIGLLATGVNDALTGFQRELAILLGTRAVLGTQGLAYLLFAVGALAYALTEFTGSAGRRRRARATRRRSGAVDAGPVIVLFALVLVGVVTAGMVVPAGAHGFDVVSSETDSERAGVIRAGTAENVTYTVPSNGVVPVVVYLEPGSEAVSVAPDRLTVPGSSRENATVTLRAPPETGFYRFELVEHRYVAVLPTGTIDALYRVHPWLPIVAIDALLGVGFTALAAAVVGWGPIRLDSGAQNVSLLSRLRRRFR